MNAFARSTDPDTSHEAAKAASSAHQVMCDEVERVLLLAGPRGMITHEVSEETSIQAWSISPRMKPMEKAQRVCRTERRRTHTGNRKSIVWVARCFATDTERAASDALYPGPV